MKVELSDEAHAQVKEIDAWWRGNRASAPDLFAAELGHALTLLEETPTLGSRYETGRIKLRRLLPQRTHYRVYFVEDDGRLVVVAVWSAFRGRGPKIE